MGKATLAFLFTLAIAAAAFFFFRQGQQINRLEEQVNSLNGLAQAQTSVSPSATPAASAVSLTMVDLIHLVQPVIVRVDVVGSGFQASGSGIIFRKDGYIITNEHVVEGARTITITLSTGQQYSAGVNSSDANLDLAIIKLSGLSGELPTALLGASSDIIVGGTVTAAGFPLGSLLPGPASFTRGIVSAVRNLGGQNYVQTDVAINPGNSGGALVTNAGKVIGITTSEVIPRGVQVVGIGLAIPIDVIQNYINANLKN